MYLCGLAGVLTGTPAVQALATRRVLVRRQLTGQDEEARTVRPDRAERG